MTDLTSSFPKNLSYSIKNLNGFSKQTIKVLSDRLSSTATAGDIIKIRLPPNSLIDMRTFSVFFSGTITGSGVNTGVEGHFPRYSSSLIQQLNVYINNSLVSTINDYNLLYNTIADLSFGSENNSKRFLENYDCTIAFPNPSGANYYSKLSRTCTSGTGNDTTKIMAINNWLGIFNSSTPVWDTGDMGDVIIELRLAPSGILWGSAPSGADAAWAGSLSYTITDIRATMSRISFNSSEYYELKSAKLLDSGLLIGFQDYYAVRGTLTTKSANVSWNYNVNANSLDYILATFQRNDYTTNNYLLLSGGYTGASGATTYADTNTTILTNYRNFTLNEAIANQSYIALTSGGSRTDSDFFANSQYFQRKGSWFKTGQFAINSVMIDPYPKPSEEVYNETLIALGLKNLDTGSSIHPGCLGLYYFLKYYFTQICSLQNLSGDSQFWRSGLNGNAASINVQYNAVFDSTATDSIYPVFFNALTKIINISAGRIINVV